jgi:hypothetical protein
VKAGRYELTCKTLKWQIRTWSVETINRSFAFANVIGIPRAPIGYEIVPIRYDGAKNKAAAKNTPKHTRLDAVRFIQEEYLLGIL